MKMMKYLSPFCLFLAGCAMPALTSCNEEWDDHYDASPLVSTSSVEVFKGDVATYLQSQPQLSKMTAMLNADNLMQGLASGNFCTVIACPDDKWDASQGTDLGNVAKYYVSDVEVAPSCLIKDYGIYSLSGKNLWVTEAANGKVVLNDKYNVTKMVKTDNGYIYYVDGLIPMQQSVYDYLMGLGDDYSLIKEYVKLFEESYFDAAASTPAGTDVMGNTYYSDSVINTRNTLMDRYTSEGLLVWNMRSENYLTTLFIPNNEQVSHAYKAALDSIPLWMNRAATSLDSLKFKKWIVSSCFVDRRLDPSEVSATAPMFDCVGDYVQEIDKTLDKCSYESVVPAHWKPSVQTVDVANPVELSNGRAYFVTNYKIPNHIVIWRVKARLYQVWNALTDEQKGWKDGEAIPGGYFRWSHWKNPLVVNDAQSPFYSYDPQTLPDIYYHVLTAIPDDEAIEGNLPCMVDYDGVVINQDDKNFGLKEVNIPAGEYYLRMGFKHSLTYSISIYFAGKNEEFGAPLVEDMSLKATGSDFHFDRGGAMAGLEFYGSESIGFPEYYNWSWWFAQDPVAYEKASAYDTDGCQVAIINLKESGNFKIRIRSNDNAELFNPGTGSAVDRSKNNVSQLMMYHWCLRPTSNNY